MLLNDYQQILSIFIWIYITICNCHNLSNKQIIVQFIGLMVHVHQVDTLTFITYLLEKELRV